MKKGKRILTYGSLLMLSLIAINTTSEVSALSVGGTGGTFATGGGGSAYYGTGFSFTGVAGLKWAPKKGPSSISSSFWGNYNISSSDKTIGSIHYYKYGNGSKYHIPHNYTGYYMQAFQFSNPGKNTWNDYNLTRNTYSPSGASWPFKTSINGATKTLGAGNLPNARAQQQALADGYSKQSSGIYTKGNDWLDAVFYQNTITRQPNSDQQTQKSFISSVRTNSMYNGEMLLESEEGLKRLFDNPKKTLDYYGRSYEKEENSGLPGYGYQNLVSGKYAEVRRTRTYNTQTSNDGGKTWSELTVKSENYQLVSMNDYSMTFKYDVTPESIKQIWFKPYSLNKNGLSDEKDIKGDFPTYQDSIKPLEISVNNLQNITNGSAIETLDTNTGTPFRIKINNKQLGIPESAFKLEDTTDPNKLTFYSYKSGPTGKFIGEDVAGNEKFNQNVNGTCYRTKYWGGSLNAGVDSSNSGGSSLTFNNVEKTGPNSMVLPIGWTGGDFQFKTIQVGNSKLINGNGLDWWTINYTAGEKYSYGIMYDGTIDVDNGFGNGPTLDPRSGSMYENLNSTQFQQPFLQGKFNAKTIGGTKW